MSKPGQRVLIALRKMIASGELAAGERIAEIPTAELLEVSRTPVRIAFRTLEQEGLLVKCAGRGYTVRAVSPADIAGAVEVRGVLEGQAARHRQLLVTSHFNQPDLQMFFREHAQSLAGSIRVKKHWGKGQLPNVIGEVKQVFQLVPGVRDFESQEDARFKYFKDNVLAPLVRLEQKHTLIVTPSYFSYVRVRNELLKQDVNAAYVCEYSRDSEISRGRSRFFHGKNDLLLYSGRAHFFRYIFSLSFFFCFECYLVSQSYRYSAITCRRFLIRGAKHIIFYSLPEYANFYSEWVNMLSSHTEGAQGGEDDGKVSCLVLFTAFERMALERIVGPKRCAQMLSASKTTFVYC